ncbi:putative hydro-lyase [Noviherbaspirillum pedocola]|uniref:Putative hydro-lyase JJB74_24475 n=1 Tax=Noviherbaspirillum pedocola TaxID=2801341 RepID=A0A934T2D2_9BURK|nr:putative hydro-lyase [Noviherbaspirillum pedocola]MBK4737789.1 putative hydro-lyase [Noviherbaspirillum pedocola]
MDLNRHPAEFRRLVRRGDFRKPTAGHGGNHAQANLAILPQQYAADFLRFCQLNPKACPLLGVSEPGDWRLPQLGADLDIRNDVPAYYLYREGRLAEELESLEAVWRDDLVTFAIGCSFSFEHVLLEYDIPVRHIEQGRNVPMFRTNIANGVAGPFGGNMVVSMRPLRAADAIRAIQITSRFPGVHGAPVHLGDPRLIGIEDLQRPDYGDAVDIAPDEIPVFWACGVTPQQAILSAELPFAIAHKPGYMLVTDVPNHRLAVL